jgi:hypothetical protein
LMPPFIHLFIKIACMLSVSKHIIVHRILLLNFKKEIEFFLEATCLWKIRNWSYHSCM